MTHTNDKAERARELETLIEALRKAFPGHAPDTRDYRFAIIEYQGQRKRAADYLAAFAKQEGEKASTGQSGGDDDETCADGSHCCCCGPGEPCCDCGLVMPSATCRGEKCWCGDPAAKKVGEEIALDDAAPGRHNLTAYVCARHYAQMMGPAGATQVGRAALSATQPSGDAS